MKLYSTIRIDMNEHEILNQPGVFDRIRRAFGGEPDLSTGKMRAVFEAAMLVDAHRRALAEVGATDAVSLVVDDLVLFEDRDRRPDDLGDLFIAFHEYAPAIADDVRVLRLTVEHHEAGVHYLIELQARTEYPKGEAPVRIIASGRLAALQPRPGETPEEYRARVEPLVTDRVGFQIAQASFDSFVSRMRDAIARAMPDARATIVPPAPTPATGRNRDQRQRPEDREYDPHETYYPNPMLGMFGVAMLGSFMMPGFAGAGTPANDGVDPAADAGDPAADAGGVDPVADAVGADDGGLFDWDW